MSSSLVDLQKLDPSIILDIRYATENNFCGQPFYLRHRCFLREPVAQKIICIQKRALAKGLSLKIFDGYRPLDVQKKLWEVVPNSSYVADPSKGSNHNRGAAVDLTLVDCHSGLALEMPTEFDDFSEKAHAHHTEGLSEGAVANRRLLRELMATEGFYQKETEWWHFDDEKAAQYPVDNVSFEELDSNGSSHG